MAATLTNDGELALTYFSFPIEKTEETGEVNPVDGTPDLLVWGKATDGTVDGDRQIVDPEWSAVALKEWFDTGANLRVQHQAQRDPAGKGVDLEVTPDGHWVKALVSEPTAKHLVRTGALNDYSVGISHPDVKYGRNQRLDPAGKAVGGIITGRQDGSSKICELSLVDRGSNFNSKFQLVKAAGNGDCEWVGKVFGADALLAKSVAAMVNPATPFNPADLAKLLEHRRLAEERQAGAVEKRDVDPDVGGGADRDKIPAEDFAGKDRSFPIVKPGDVSDAASSIGRAGDGNYPPDELKSNIIRIANRKGPSFAAELPDAWKDGGDAGKAAGVDGEDGAAKTAPPAKAGRKCKLCKGTGKIRDGKLTCPRCHGDGRIVMGETDEHGDGQDKDAEPDAVKAGARDCPKCGKNHHSDSPAKFCDSCGTKLPKASKAEGEPEAVKAGGTMDDPPADPDADDDDSGDDQDGDDAKPGDSGSDDPDPADGSAKAAAPMTARKPKVACPGCGKMVKGKMAFCPGCGGGMKPKAGKSAKAAKENARTKPTPGDGVTGERTEPVPAHREPDGPYIESLENDARIPTVPDADVEKAVSLRFKALGVPVALGVLHDLTCAAYAPADVSKCHPRASLSDIDPAGWMDKALDAAASAPLEEAGRAQLAWQNAIALKGADPLDVEEIAEAVHKAFQDANPGPGKFPTPSELSPARFRRPYIDAGHAANSPQAGGPNTAKLPPMGGISASQFDRPYLADGRADDSPSNKADGDAPPKPGAARHFYRNTVRDNTRAAMQAMHDHIAETFPDLCAMDSDPNADAPPKPNPLPRPAASVKAAEPDTVKPGREAYVRGGIDLGLWTAQEAAALLGEQPAPVLKAAAAAAPDLIKAAVAEATAGLSGQLTDALKALKKHGKVLDAIASQPDTSNAPYRGVALQQESKSQAPAGPPTMRDASERAQSAMYDELYREWRDSPDPGTRLAAERAMAKMRGLPNARQ